MKRKKIRIIIIFFIFIFYFFLAARPIPRETILAPGWIGSLETDTSTVINKNVSEAGQFLPFTLGSRFGYVDASGQFAINMINTGAVYLSPDMWTEYAAEPSNIQIKNISGETVINIENPGGYPVLLDNRVFIIGREMNALSEIDAGGNVKWTYEFGSILTCIDAASGLVITGSLDGVVEILNPEGVRIFYFEPGGSRLETVYGCAISRDGSRAGIICGIDQQRFILLERFGNTGGDYKVVFHEFLDIGFRRAVFVSFIDEDRRVVYERLGGIGCYNIKSRRAVFIPIEGEIAAIDTSGEKGLFFLITSNSQRQELIGIKFLQERRFGLSTAAGASDSIFLKAPFKSDNVFLGRTGSMLVAGGGSTLVSFNLGYK